MVVVFDLDDTLYKEIDFLKSGFGKIASCLQNQQTETVFAKMMEFYNTGRNVFASIIQEYNLDYSITDLLNMYREHKPNIVLSSDSKELLDYLIKQGCVIGLLTDGRKTTQYNKIESLELFRYIKRSNIVISEEFGSEKPSEGNYRYFMNQYPNDEYVYIGDNLKKDFITPNRLGWQTICLIDNGQNIHKQVYNLPQDYLPQAFVVNMKDVIKYIDEN